MLSDLGITKDQSSRWQKLAQVPEKNFERRLEEARHEQSPACCLSIRESKATLLDVNISAVNIPRGMLCRTGKRICAATCARGALRLPLTLPHRLRSGYER
jgi:hypothetical protein